MKRLVWLPAAGFLLIAGAAAAVAAPDVADRAAGMLDDLGASIGAASSPAPSDGSEEEPVEREGFGLLRGGEPLLDEVLDELVASGVITQEQSDAITQALTDKAEQRRAEFEAERERLEQMWTQIRGFLEDDVITSEEIAQLPDDNPFSNVRDILADGQITRDELESVAPFAGVIVDGPRHFGPGGPRHGHGWFVDRADDAGSGSDSV